MNQESCPSDTTDGQKDSVQAAKSNDMPSLLTTSAPQPDIQPFASNSGDKRDESTSTRPNEEPLFRLPSLSTFSDSGFRGGGGGGGGGRIINSHAPPLSRSTSFPMQQTTQISTNVMTKSSTSSPSPSSVQSTPVTSSRADAFMASLLRAAQSDSSSSQTDRMSVSSVLDPASSSMEESRQPKKMRLSSIKEPFESSASHDQIATTRTSSSTTTSSSSSTSSSTSSAPSMPSFAALRPTLPSYSLSPLHMSLPRPPPSSSLSYPTQRSISAMPTYQSSDLGDRYQGRPISSPQRMSYTSSTPSTSSSSTSSYPYPPIHLSRSSHTSSFETVAPPNQTKIEGDESNGSGTISNPTNTSSLGKRPYPVDSALASKFIEEEQRWTAFESSEKTLKVRENILSARNDLLRRSNDKSLWTSSNSIMTSVRCMYANIAQKSYGSEKRFLCPPPVIKIDGPLRPCKWACARVVSGDSPTPSSISIRSVQIGGTSGEEEAMVDGNREARFGKLHVGSLSESRGKTFRLQINLLRAEETEEARRAIMMNFQSQSHPSRVIAPGAWSTFHSAPISVISKPARKSARTRAASPAISSGSIVCLYNRLNSQTVRTKYLAVEASLPDEINDGKSRRLIARQDGWEGFSIDLLARPLLREGDSTYSSRKTWVNEEEEITYGCIVCLRDVRTNVCSDPMLICKVDKGKVDISNLTSQTLNSKLRFQIVEKDRITNKEILLGGKRQIGASFETSFVGPLLDSSTTRRRDSFESSGESTSTTANMSTGQGSNSIPTNTEVNNSIGGAVTQMQKVTLMHISPRISSSYNDEIECDLNGPRSYLSSTAFEGPPDTHTTAALVRSKKRLQSRLQALQTGSNPLDEEGEENDNAGKVRDAQSSTYPVGFVRPPTALLNSTSRPCQVDLLEDPFCWTIVTISQSDVSFIEANARVPFQNPHIPSSSLPITPFPSVAAIPSYDYQRHAVSATIHDFHYSHDQQHRNVNNVCAMGSPAMSNLAHEIWLGQSGPLQAHSTSAGPYMSDVTFQLPSVAHLLALHKEFHGAQEGRKIQLPFLFVRLNQGIAFFSGHWLLAVYREKGQYGSKIGGNPDASTSWDFTVK